MNDIKIIKSLEDSGVLIDRVTETRRRIYWSFVKTFSRFNSATSNFFSSKRSKWNRSKNSRKMIYGQKYMPFFQETIYPGSIKENQM